jgi:hypothetical protein
MIKYSALVQDDERNARYRSNNDAR